VADNTTLNPATGGDVVRDKDRSGVKTPIVGLDLNPAGAEVLGTGDATNGLDVDVTRVQGTVTVDSELAAAVALSDTVSRTVTTAIVGAANLVDDGTQLTRQRAAAATGGTKGSVGLAAVTPYIFSGGGDFWVSLYSAFAHGDNASGGASAMVTPGAVNGSGNVDRWRNNVEGPVLASAARTATPSVSNIANYNAAGVRLFLNVTATPNNAETLTVAIEWVDPVSAAVKALTAFPAITASSLGASPAAGVREFVYELYPGSVETVAVANHEVQGGSLPRTLHPKVTHSSTGSWTYSLGYGLVL
jgi:hypothetical protein